MKLFKFLIIIIMITRSQQADKIEIKKLENNPGILPFKLGNVRIQKSHHTFIHNYRLTSLTNHYYNLDQCLKQMQTKGNKITDKTLSYEIKVELTFIEHQLKYIRNELTLIHPNIFNQDSKREKRGVINGLGSIFKFISGNLDASDGERYDNAIRTLAENQDNLFKNYNQQISINRKLIQEYNTIFKNMTDNFAIINSSLQIVKDQQFKQALLLLQITITDFERLIDTLQTALSFATLNVVHLSIITEKQLDVMKTEIRKHHNENEIYSNDNILFTRTIEVDFYITEDHIVFLLHVPIIDKKDFTLYHMYSVPTTRQTVIISPTPYVAIAEDKIYYLKEKCKFLQNQFYCSINNIEYNYQEDKCIRNLLQVRTDFECINVKVNITENFIESINAERYLAILPQKILIHEKCSHEEVHELQGVYYIQVPYSCSFIAKDFQYLNLETALPEEPVYLPTISHITSNIRPIQFNLKSIKLDQLSKLTLDLDKAISVNYPILSSNTSHFLFYFIVIILIVILDIMIIVYILYKKRIISKKRITRIFMRKENRIDKDEESQGQDAIILPTPSTSWH